MNINKILCKLRAERDRIDQEISALEDCGEHAARQSLVMVARRPTENPEDSDEFSALRTEQLFRALSLSRILRLAWVIGLVAVSIGSLAPAQSGVMHVIDLGGINDKIEHFTAYAVLAALPSLGLFRCRRLGATIVALFLLGAALEIGQLFSPGRTCDWHDLLANSCGILAGVALVALVRITRLAFRRHFSAPLPPAT